MVLSARIIKFFFSRARRMADRALHEGIKSVLRPYVTRTGRRRHQSNRFDEEWHVETEKPARVFDLTVISENEFYASSYAASPPEVVTRLISNLRIRYEEFLFIDLGSGKGRVLLIASQFPFKKIIGVEFSPELVQTSLRNIATCSGPNRRCDDIESLCMDATDYEFPGENLVVYLYYPFDGKVMRKVIEGLRLCFEKYRRQIIVVYLTPSCAYLFDREPWLIKDPGLTGAAIYRTGPSPA